VSDYDVALALSRAALNSLERNRRRLDDLNVYPVPDGDTGTNMTLTVRAVVEALEADGDLTADRAAVAKFVARAALLGGRGNSGVILSVILRGVTDVLGEADPIDANAVAAALRSASDLAYSKVSNPVEGTMLTAIRVLAETAESAGELELPQLMRLLVERGDAAVLRTQEQLEILRDAGVVDAGAAGLLEVVRGVASQVTGEPLPEAPEEEYASVESAHQELSEFRYCTGFVVEGDDLDADALELELAALGDSLLVVGDETALKVHVHTDDPGRALQLATAMGVVEAVEVANMHRQTAEREVRLLDTAEETASTALVAVSVGAGNRQLFESSGATVVDGGETMNPSTEALVRAIESAPGAEVVLLPNNPNVFMAAEEAASLAGKPVHVVRSGSIQAGLAAAIAHDGSRSADEDAAELAEIAEAVVVGAVTVASRSVEGVAEAGDYLGLVGREPIVGGKELAGVAEKVVEALLAEPHDLLTVLTGGDDELDGLLMRIESRWPELEVHVHAGGQPHYQLLLSAE
jgi:uncharacterized protein